MKKILLLLICTCLSVGSNAQNVIGAWEFFTTSETGEQQRNVALFVDGYQSLTTYNATTGKFINSKGGSWKLEGDKMTEKLEFNTNNPEEIGEETSFKISVKDSIMEIVDTKTKLKRIDKGVPGKLQGAWLMSGRVRDGETQLRDTSGPRKTMKILTGTRFQWIAYNTETKQFIGTGGGTYTTKNGEYSENIEFFSKDDSKAGLSLQFNYELIDGDWHHSGLSSKGDPIYEIWSIRK